MSATTNALATTRGRIRFSIVAMLFAVTIVNYADRASIAIASPGGNGAAGATACTAAALVSISRAVSRRRVRGCVDVARCAWRLIRALSIASRPLGDT